MCGIIALLGSESTEIILKSLYQLQNRGYDSAGISSIMCNKYTISKKASIENTDALKLLENTIHIHNGSKNYIAHTRWATHGKKNDCNSHPHISNCGKFSLVHNGIIENYLDLKAFLVEKAYHFKSETDTEIIVNLLGYEFSITNCVETSIKETIKQLKGSWAIVIQCIDFPNRIFCTRKGSPLLIGKNNNCGMIVSEQSAFLNTMENYIILDNNDICYLEYNNNTIKINTCNHYSIKNSILKNIQLTPHPFPHWTIKEIYEQSQSSFRSLGQGGRIKDSSTVKLGGLESYSNIIKTLDNIIILGCGTSYFAGLLSSIYFKKITNLNSVQVINGAEFNTEDIPRIGNTALIFLSQSGETKDLHRCIDIGKKNHLFTIGVINVVDSMIAREVNCGCYLNAGREVAVASTKSFTSMVVVLSLIAVFFSQLHNTSIELRKTLISDLQKLPNDIKKTIEISNNELDNYLHFYNNRNSMFILGKSEGEAVAREAALKIKEITYIHAEGYSSSSLKHGPFALLNKGFPVILLSPNNEFYYKSMNIYEEIKSREATILFITDNSKCSFENKLILPKNETYANLLCIIPLQLLAYKLSVNKGINPDKPKNLAKVVTVE